MSAGSGVAMVPDTWRDYGKPVTGKAEVRTE